MKLSRDPANSRVFVKTTLSEQTYEALKERILDQTFAPGTRLAIDAISRELNVSSSPIREALARLEAERLVVSELYAGYSVAPHPKPAYLHDLLDFRILIEGYCARIGAPKRLPGILRELEKSVEKMATTRRLGTKYREYRKFIQADGKFHQAIIDSAGNEAISGTYAGMHVILLQSRLYLNRRGGSTPSDEVMQEHYAILRAFQAGDGEAAAEAVRLHLEGGRRRLVSAMEE